MRDAPLPGTTGALPTGSTGLPRYLLLPLLAAFAGGIVLSVQSFLNGRLAGSLDSVPIAGSVNHLTGLTALFLLAGATGAPRRAVRHVATVPRPRWWCFVAGINGGYFVLVTAHAAPRIGIALLTVALVCGQSTGSLIVDRLGLSPAGVRPFTVPRVLGVVIAVAAVGLGAVGAAGGLHPELLFLAVIAGAGVAVQHAALGRTARWSGEPLVAGIINMGAGFAALIVVVLLATGGALPTDLSAPPLQWCGGVLGAGIAVGVSLLVRTLGALRLMLTTVAGQTVGGLLLDLVAAPPGKVVTALTVLSAALTIVAVVVGSRPSRRGPGLEDAAVIP